MTVAVKGGRGAKLCVCGGDWRAQPALNFRGGVGLNLSQILREFLFNRSHCFYVQVISVGGGEWLP